MKLIGIHLLVAWALVIVTLALIGFYIPPKEKTLGESYLIFFFHFPSAMNCLNFFFFGGICSAVYLVKRSPGWDHWATSAIEVGVLACTVTLVTGSIWAKAAWGKWWVINDPRLMSVAVMWLTYLAYLALRATMDEPEKRARFCAVFGVLATLNVPMVYFAIKWLGKTSHPMTVSLGDPSMVQTRWLGAFAFFVLYCAFWRMRRFCAAQQYNTSVLEESCSRAGL